MIRLSFYGLCLGLLAVPNMTAAEPVPQISKPRPSKSKKKAAQDRKAHTAIKRARRARNERARSAPGACSLKPMKAVQRMRIDPQVERLFQKAMTMDGALYPSMRTSLKSCCPKNDAGDCYSQSEAETRHACYDRRVPTDFREITRKMGVKIGAGPYSDTRKSTIERYRSEGRNIRLVRTSNDLDRAVRQDDYGTVLYIQSWDESHYDLDPLPLVKHLYQRGARIVQPAYNEDNNDELKTRFAGGADRDDQRLTKAGRTLIQGLLDQFILVDLSHVGRKSALEIINMALREDRPVTANHANAIGVYDDRPGSEACPGGCVSRNHTDDVICGIARTGGVIGFTPIRFMFAPKVGDTYMKATENDFIRHLNYVAKQLKCTSKGGKKGRRIDMTRHISLGSDGRMNGYDKRVAWLYMKMGNRLDRWKRIATRLKNECGYSMKEISALISGNLERVYRESLPGVMRPVTTRPRSNERVSTRTVEFRWQRPVVNQPKWRPRPIDTISTPRSFQLIIERKTNGSYTRVKNLKLGDVLKRRVNLETGAYRWFVKAKGSRVDVNSRWQYFKRI